MLTACSRAPAPTALRPADVLEKSAMPLPLAGTATHGKFHDSWNVQPRPKGSLDVKALQTKSENDQAAKTFMATSPLFQRRVRGDSLDAVAKSINDITAELPELQAKGFQQAAKLLMVSELPIDQAMQTHRNLSDQEISDSVVRSLSGKTPWEILVAGRQKRQELEAKLASEQNQTPVADALAN